MNKEKIISKIKNILNKMKIKIQHINICEMQLSSGKIIILNILEKKKGLILVIISSTLRN